MKKQVERLLGGMVVSCQAYEGTPSYGVEYITMFAKAALMGGADGIRACWPENIAAIRKLGDFPIIGIFKKIDEDTSTEPDPNEIFITPTYEMASECIEAGADIIALDCSVRGKRTFDDLCQLLQKIRDNYPEVAIMADLITAEEGINLAKTGLVDILSTTLSDLDPNREQKGIPAYDMCLEMKEKTGLPINLEGHVWEVTQIEKSIEAGADMISIGSAITRPHLITERFVNANTRYRKK